MSDVQARVEELLAGHLPQSVGPVMWPKCFSHRVPVDYTPAHVAAVLAEAGLLADPERDFVGVAAAEADAKQERSAADAARAELAEVKAELGQWKDRMWATVHERAVWQHDLGEHTGDLPFMHCPECGRIEAVRRSDNAERRGAVAALREAADEYAKGQGYQRMVAANLRDRADRIEKGDDRG